MRPGRTFVSHLPKRLPKNAHDKSGITGGLLFRVELPEDAAQFRMPVSEISKVVVQELSVDAMRRRVGHGRAVFRVKYASMIGRSASAQSRVCNSAG